MLGPFTAGGTTPPSSARKASLHQHLAASACSITTTPPREGTLSRKGGTPSRLQVQHLWAFLTPAAKSSVSRNTTHLSDAGPPTLQRMLQRNPSWGPGRSQAAHTSQGAPEAPVASSGVEMPVCSAPPAQQGASFSKSAGAPKSPPSEPPEHVKGERCGAESGGQLVCTDTSEPPVNGIRAGKGVVDAVPPASDLTDSCCAAETLRVEPEGGAAMSSLVGAADAHQ